MCRRGAESELTAWVTPIGTGRRKVHGQFSSIFLITTPFHFSGLVVSLLERSSLYRQWRPRRFDEVVGQEHVVTTLKNAVKRDQVAHAYIFAGPRGTGKTTVARLLAKIVNCPETRGSAEPCNECDQCLAIDSGSSMNMIEVDAASHRGIDDIRELQEKVPYAATSGRFRVYILDEAHMLTTEAFNALLKTLEEPPEHVIFILATTEPHKIPVTVQSRCQRFDYRFLTADEIAERLKQVVAADENLAVTEPAIWTIALYAEGAVRDALGLLEQCRDYSEGEVSEEAVRRVIGAVSRQTLVEYARHLRDGDIAGLMDLIDEVSMAGADMGQFIRDLLSLARDLLLFRASDGARRPVMPDEDLTAMCEVADQYELSQLLNLVDQLASAEDRTRYSAQPRFLLEMTSIRLAGEFGRRLQDPVTSAEQSTVRGESKSDSPEQVERPAGSVDFDTTGESDPVSDIRAIWERVKEEVREASLPTHALLQPACPGGITDGAFVLVFGDEYKFHRDRTEKEGRQLIQEVLKRVTGRDLALRCKMEADFSPGDTGNDEPQADEPAEGDHNSINSARDTAPSGDHRDDPDDGRESSGAAHQAVRSRGGECTDGESAGVEDAGTSSENDGDDSVDEVVSMFSGKIVGKLSEMDVPGVDEIAEGRDMSEGRDSDELW